jgi:hypothetical protein
VGRADLVTAGAIELAHGVSGVLAADAREEKWWWSEGFSSRPLGRTVHIPSTTGINGGR